MIPRSLFAPIAAALAAALPAPALAAVVPVASPQDVQNAMQTAQPGDVLELADGVYTDQLFRFEGDGQPGAPITLRPETPGGARLTGSSRLEIGGTHLVVEGLWFDGGSLGSGHIVRFRTGTISHHCTLRDVAITGYNPPDRSTRYFWVSLYGTNNTVEHCRFENHDHSGVTLCVWGDWPNNHTVRRNHFVDRPAGPANGWETIRVGTSDFQDQPSRTLVEENLFQRADGEIEAISSKTGENVYHANTFRETSATLTLRHGFACDVVGNFFLGENTPGAGGVRVIGPDHRVWNNYFADLPGRTDGVIALEAGEPNAPNNGYQPVVGGFVGFNTFVNCGEPAIITNRSINSGDRTALPTGVDIVGNVAASPGQPLAVGSNPNLTWASNFVFGGGPGAAPAGAVTVLGAHPLGPVGPDGLRRPAPGGSLENAIDPADTPPFVTLDMDGQPRSHPHDAGADEIVAAAVTRAPLDENDVGPSWWPLADPPPNVDPARGAAFEAEDLDALLDPDQDGDVFEVVAAPAASGGQAIRAPGGSRTDLSDDPHETIALYVLLFPEAGPYTPYYRARGFGSSSDSFFRPASLDADPSINETISSDGAFRWEEGPALASPGAGQAAELRIGRREGDAEIDAVVLYPEPGLDDAALLYLLEQAAAPPACPADRNADGVADAFDLFDWAAHAQASLPSADLTGDGAVGREDGIAFLIALAAGCS